MVFVTKKRRRDKNEQKVEFLIVFVRVLIEHAQTHTQKVTDPVCSAMQQNFCVFFLVQKRKEKRGMDVCLVCFWMAFFVIHFF